MATSNRESLQTARQSVRVFCDYFLPSQRAGGPAKSLHGIFSALGGECDFEVITRDRDRGMARAYDDVEPGRQQQCYSASVLYTPPSIGRLWVIWRALSQRRANVIYLNSFFSPIFTIFPLTLLRLRFVARPSKVIVAPRGELAESALKIKSPRKQSYLRLAKMLGLYKNAVWHVESEKERREVERALGVHLNIDAAQTEVLVAPPPLADIPRLPGKRKAQGHLKIVFLSRISRIKNLQFAIEVVGGLSGDVEFDIFGPFPRAEDAAYWRECQVNLSELPDNISVRYCGEVERDEVVATLRPYHLFILPTLGENYGHVIVEALSAGCMLCISDQTPWRALEDKRIGWDIPLQQTERFREVLQHCVAMDDQEFTAHTSSIQYYLEHTISGATVHSQNLRLFT
ncbi:MAG: glycosyltransferase [Pseudomonadota bacterium]